MYYLTAVAVYRHQLACVLIRDRESLQSTGSTTPPSVGYWHHIFTVRVGAHKPYTRDDAITEV